MTFGLAPGYAARTTTVGGTTLGYSLTGRRTSARLPAARISSEMTTAKIGRSMKNCASFIASLPAFARVALRRGRLFHGDGHRIDLHARPHTLQAADDDPVAGAEAGAHDPQPVDDGPERHAAVDNRPLRRDEIHEALVQIGADRAILNQQPA